MSRIRRRGFLAASGAALVASTLGARAGESRSPTAGLPAPPALPVSAAWDEAPRVPLWPRSAPGAEDFAPEPVPADWPASHLRAVAMPELRVFRPREPNGRAVLLVPGGAYWFVSFVNEGVEVAQALNARGYTAFVLTYRLPGEGWRHRADVPLQDAQRAMRVIRAQAGRWGVDAATVAATGFSAGGHIAATLATRHGERIAGPRDDIDVLDARPHAVALVYPVVTLEDRWTHELSRRLLLGERITRAEIARRSAERQVGPETAPLFLVHAVDDTAVPVENSLRLLAAMREARRPVEAHLLQEGGHAFGVGRPGTPSAQWIDLMCAWLPRVDRERQA